MRRLLTAAAACAALALSACGGTGGDSGEASPEASASSSATAPERPRVGDCHRLTQRDVLEASDTEPTVACSDKHTSETVHVATFPPVAQGSLQQLTSDEVNRRASRTCNERAAAYLGADRESLRLTRVEVFWFVPTPDQVDAGADWLRCDAVVLQGEERLLPLPPSMKGALADERGLDRYGLCGTARPGSKDFQRVVCSEQHSWRAVSTIPLEGGSRYPGAGDVRSQGEEPCQGQARAAQGDALQYDYGWEWPTKAQWQAGQRYGYCWAPA